MKIIVTSFVHENWSAAFTPLQGPHAKALVELAGLSHIEAGSSPRSFVLRMVSKVS